MATFPVELGANGVRQATYAPFEDELCRSDRRSIYSLAASRTIRPEDSHYSPVVNSCRGSFSSSCHVILPRLRRASFNGFLTGKNKQLPLVTYIWYSHIRMESTGKQAVQARCQLIFLIIPALIIHHSFTLSPQAKNLPF